MKHQKKPRLSFWQIWNMSFGFFGIQMGFALQNANVSRIFESLGAKIEDIPILWIAAPITGLIVQPIIGHLSDKTWGRLGRRRPYFLAGALLASAALFFMPNSPALWIAAGMLWIMDASINISMEPFRAFVGDNLPDEQRTIGFAMQSFFIGIGAYIASSLPYIMTNWFDISNIPSDENPIPESVKLSFYIGGGVFFLSVLFTVIFSKEYSPEELKAFQDKEEVSENETDQFNAPQKFIRNGFIYILSGIILFLPVYYLNLESELYILSGGVTLYGLLQFLSAWNINGKRKANGLTIVINDLYNMPKTMKQLAIVQFFSWFALFAMWIYSTAAVTGHIYGTSDTKSALYNEGADWVGVLFAYYNLFAGGFAFFLPLLAKWTNRKITHGIALLAGGLSLISFFFIHNPDYLLYSMLGVGLAWAAILSMPYAILTGALPQNKMGTYMGIFNFFIVIPQILAASILGFLVKTVFSSEPVYALILGGASMIIAAVIMQFVNDKK